MSAFRTRYLQEPKSVLTPQECQDAFAADRERNRYAIADGVTQSVFAREWAEIVAKRVCKIDKLCAESVARELPDWRQEWELGLPEGPRPWNVARKLKDVGAHTTMIALELGRRGERGGSAYFNVLAVGDSCVFQVRKDRLIYAFPYGRASDFNESSTRTLASLSRWDASGPDGSIYSSAEKVPRQGHDRFILASDAFARYLLSEVGLGCTGVSEAMPLTGGKSFNRWVQHRREDGRLDDDDTTLVLIRT